MATDQRHSHIEGRLVKALKARVDMLMTRNAISGLTPAETVELQGLVHAEFAAQHNLSSPWRTRGGYSCPCSCGFTSKVTRWKEDATRAGQTHRRAALKRQGASK